MKGMLWLAIATAGLLPLAVLAQTADDKSPEKMRERMELQKQQMDLERQKTDMLFQQEMKKIELEKARAALSRPPDGPRPDMSGCPIGGFRKHHVLRHVACMTVWMGFCGVLHILLAIVVYRDIRKRNAGSGLWLVVVLMSGFFGALLYALFRLGDIRAGGPESR